MTGSLSPPVSVASSAAPPTADPTPESVWMPGPGDGPPTLTLRRETWPITGAFVLSRGARTEAVVVVAELRQTLADGRQIIGRGECVPYARYGEVPDQVMADLEAMADPVAAGLTPAGLIDRMPPGAARNALDCALLDLAAKRARRPVWSLLGCDAPRPAVTAVTISLGAPETMEAKARTLAVHPLLKIKVDGRGAVDQVAAVRRGAPTARLIVDANEGWHPRDLPALLDAMAEYRVDLVEQPVPAGEDRLLDSLDSPVPLCADESSHGIADLDRLMGRYAYINIKLDKTGGLTAALALAAAARARGFGLMIGCMLGTSLAMAPALLLANQAEFVDLDGPLLLMRDRIPGLTFEGSTVTPPPPDLWG